MEALRRPLTLLLLLAFVERSASVRCFAYFDPDSGECDSEIGEVDEDDCCQNSQYGYLEPDGTCHSCGPPAWSPWSSWSSCNILCGEGVRQRHRKCNGVGQAECEDPKDNLHVEPCNGTCCDDTGWDSWLAWSPCSVTCGGVGVRKRERVCTSPPECSAACGGPSEETERCESVNACPVHGSWSGWSGWSPCSDTCIDDRRSDVIVPTRTRQRSCSSPAPSADTVPPGDGCPGEAAQQQDCSEIPNCPVNGNWGAWSPPGACSVSCGEGLQLSLRKCDSPEPKYGGKICEGPSSRSSICQSPCPTHGFWSGWSPWSDCSSNCNPETRPAVRTRQRSCNNPAPSSAPPGRACEGDNRQMENCHHLPHCPVDGSWGPWSQFSPCPVTCGVGIQESVRSCSSPTPKHGGSLCPGERQRSVVCSTDVHCPVHGVWSEWSPWRECKYPFGKKNIRCEKIGGFQTRNRECLHRAHNGSFCTGAGGLTDRRVCYDVNNCNKLKGTWEGWGPWDFCKPSCGEKSQRVRRRICKPDYSEYRPTIGRQGEEATFFGTPSPAICGPTPDGGKPYQIQPCVNAPPCT